MDQFESTWQFYFSLSGSQSDSGRAKRTGWQLGGRDPDAPPRRRGRGRAHQGGRGAVQTAHDQGRDSPIVKTLFFN
jgi:hypothetical protein